MVSFSRYCQIVSEFSVERFYAYFVRFIPSFKKMLLKIIVFKFLFSNCLLPTYNNTIIDFYILTLHPAAVLHSLSNSNLSVDYFRFSVNNHVISE